MSIEARTGKAGIVVAPDDANELEKAAHVVLDDLLHNIVHDLLLKVHRDEKMARASTAAIKVEKLASGASDSSFDAIPDVRIETDAAIYEDGKVVLKGNPLKTTREILCPRCHLPRLLYPTDGKGARKPDPGVIYCKKHPYIDKPGYDIYGQTWLPTGPGRGKKKRDLDKRLDFNSDSPSPALGTDGSAKDRRTNVLSFPSATCSKCKRCILVSRLNNHMSSCIGNNGRNASRAAAQKISNGGSTNGSQKEDNTPPGSQKGTPLPASRAASPRKRDGSELDEDAEETDVANPKKKAKPTPLPRKVILKTKGSKKEKIKGASLLSREQKLDGDGSRPKGATGTMGTTGTSGTTGTTGTTGITGEVVSKKKNATPVKKTKLPPTSRPSVPPAAAKADGKDADAASESSGTLSSPPR